MKPSFRFNLNRQTIINQVHDHFIVNRQPSGCDLDYRTVYHGTDSTGHHVACAIGIFDTHNLLTERYSASMVPAIPRTVLETIFGCALTPDDVHFLHELQCEHDLAVRATRAAYTERDTNFDDYFVEELAHRLARLAAECDLRSPCSLAELTYIA